MSNFDFNIKSEGPAVIITLYNRDFSTYCKAIERCSKLFGGQKIFFIQSIEKENEPFRILVVFEFTK